MSVLLLVLSALVLIYFSIGGKTAAIVMSVATLIGVANDDWHILSFLIGGILLALALLITLPGDLRLDKFSRPLLGWVRGRLPKLSQIGRASCRERGAVAMVSAP